MSTTYVFAFICECKQARPCATGSGRKMANREREGEIAAAEYNVRLEGLEGSLIVETRCGLGNGMSSFLSVLSLPKIRGISAIKIRVFDYPRFSRPPSLPYPPPISVPPLPIRPHLLFQLSRKHLPQTGVQEFNGSISMHQIPQSVIYLFGCISHWDFEGHRWRYHFIVPRV